MTASRSIIRWRMSRARATCWTPARASPAAMRCIACSISTMLTPCGCCSRAVADPNEPALGPPTADWGSPLLWAIRRRRSRAHVAALLDAGADACGQNAGRSQCLHAGPAVWASGCRGAAEPGSWRRARFRRTSSSSRPARAVTRPDARRILSRRHDLPAALSEPQLRLLPELAAEGCGEAVRLMVKLGWPIAVPGGDWNASALNHAVFRGDAELTRFLLDHGASWKEQHGHDDNACGTLSWASCNEPVDGGDWLGCAEALIARRHAGRAARP